MSYVQEQQKRLMREKLVNEAKLNSTDLEEIIYSYQTASGNAMGVGKIMGILDFLKHGNSITFLNKQGKTEKINDKFELAKILHSFDNLIDIPSSRFFKEYF